jgi:hypothetical protein
MVDRTALFLQYDLLNSNTRHKLTSLPETPEKILTRLIESYSHEQRPTDGEIFRKIRFYHHQQDQVAEDRWWACLDKSKPRDLRQLLKRPKLISAFDRLIDMPGLWQGVQIGALHRLLVLKCEEV